MNKDIDLSEIDKKYKGKCSLIKAGKCKNVNIFLQQSRENAELKEKIKKYATINEQDTKDYAELKAENARQKKTIEKQWKLLEQCGVSAGGELKRVSYLLEKLREELTRLKKENEILLDQLVINDGEEVTVLISLEQFNEYNKFRQTLHEIKEILCQGRTFYDGYFNNPEKLSRCDKAIYLITKAEEE